MININLLDSVESVFQSALLKTKDKPSLANFDLVLRKAHQRLHQPMRVAIVGIIKAGKSTLMNALLGESVVATGTVEATFNVNWLKYSSTPSLIVHFKDDRHPEAKSFEELQQITLRAKENQDYLLSIKYIEVGYPNSILQILNLIDTPGLDSFYKDDAQNTVNFLKLHGQELTKITQTEASNADAVMYLFSQSISTTDKDIMETFAGSTLNQATPINAIGVMTKVDNCWSDYDNPMLGVQKIVKRLSEHPQIKRLFYTISPICGLLALGAQTLTYDEFQILTELAKVPTDFLRSKLSVQERFTQREYSEFTISSAQRKLLWDRLGQYGVWLACSVITSGIDNLEDLKLELLKASGVSELKELILSHFGRRAFLIKFNTALREINAAYFKERYELSEDERNIVEEIVGEFEEIEDNAVGFSELKVLKNYYNGQLDLDENEIKDLLEITGEYGTNFSEKLGLTTPYSSQEMIQIVLQKMNYWQTKANDSLVINQNSVFAARILARSYEQILYQIKASLK